MKKLLSILLGLPLILNFGCTTQSTSEDVKPQEISLEGTWRLVKTIEIGHEDITNRMDSKQKMYMKHINKTHWTWAEYDYENDQFLGAGGGTYTLEGNVYTEDIKFYHPPGSNELGQAIPFTIEMTDSLWRITGYVKMMEFDPESGENIVADSAIIDEYWERVDVQPSDDTDGKLYGTWNLISYKNPADTIWKEYPDFVGYMKLLSLTHWVVVRYNKEGDEIMGMAGGTYSVREDQYWEKLSFVYPRNLNRVGTTSTFTYEMKNDDHWRIVGSINGRNDDIVEIDETWRRYSEPIMAMNE